MIYCPIKVLERQQNLKRLVINNAIFDDSVFEIIGRNCKNLEILKICSCGFLTQNGGTDMSIQYELIHLKHMTIRGLKNFRSTYILSSLIQTCKALVSLDIEGKSFQFVAYRYIFINDFYLQI